MPTLTDRFALPWPLLALACSACAGWPLYAEPPGADPDAIAAPDDPRTLVEVSWQAETEAVDNGDPTALAPIALRPDEGRVIGGSLSGTGWYDDAIPVQFSSEECDSQGARTPFETGDYLGDVDYALIEVPDGGQLCATVSTDAPDAGWDLLLVEVDDCGVPTEFVMAGEDPRGYGLGGTGGGWTEILDPGTTWAVQLAGYYPNDLERDVLYRLGLSVLATGEGGEPGPCPLLPEEAR